MSDEYYGYMSYEVLLCPVYFTCVVNNLLIARFLEFVVCCWKFPTWNYTFYRCCFVSNGFKCCSISTMSDLASIRMRLMKLDYHQEDSCSSTNSLKEEKPADFRVRRGTRLSLSSLSLSDAPLAYKPDERKSEVENENVRIVKPEDLYLEMKSEIKEAAELTRLSPTSVRILLNMFKWDKAKMLEQTKYGESFLHLRDVGIIINPTQSVGSPIVTPGLINHHGGACLVCRRITSIMSMVITACDHWICIRCFQRHLISQIETGGRSHIQCPFVFCSMFLDDDTVLRHIPPHLIQSFTYLCMDDFVLKSKYRRKCPMGGCYLTSYYDVDSFPNFKKVHCDCGTNYCFGCGLELWDCPTFRRLPPQWSKTCSSMMA